MSARDVSSSHRGMGHYSLFKVAAATPAQATKAPAAAKPAASCEVVTMPLDKEHSARRSGDKPRRGIDTGNHYSLAHGAVIIGMVA